MTATYHRQKNRLIGLILSTLFVFNALVAYYIYLSQKDRLENDAKSRTALEIRLIGGFLTDAVLRHDYAEARNFLRKWVEGRSEIILLEVNFRSGKTLFSHQTRTLPKLQIAECGSVKIGERTLDIRLAHDRNEIAASLNLLAWLLVLFVTALTLIVGAMLWAVLSRWILKPFGDEISRQTRELEKLNRAYRALGESNMTLLTAGSEPDLLDRVCKIVGEDGDYALVWIGYALNDEERTIRIMSSHGKAGGYVQSLALCWSEKPCGQGPSGRSIAEQKTVIVNDIENDTTFLPWREQALQNGLRASAAFPIIFKDKAIGMMGVYSRVKNPFSENEVLLLSKLTANLAFGIMALRDRRRVEELSVTDPLTGLYNRHHINQVLASEQARFVRYNKVFSVVIADIDHFKQVNDTYGHQAGDEALKAFSAVLNANRRGPDVIGRWGGEEFIAVLPDTGQKEAIHFAERIRSAVETASFGVPGRITASFGVASALHDEPLNQLVLRADQSLYRAKNKGRNRVEPA